MQGSYRQFCPLAMAAEILCTRWTMLVLREMIAGSTRFNDLRRGVPRMSPALLAKRLRELERAGIVRHEPSPGAPGIREYRLTEAGQHLQPVIEAMGLWGQTWIETRLSLSGLDPSLLMWDMRRNLDPNPRPQRRVVVQFLYPEMPATQRRWWMVVETDGGVDLCVIDPGFEVDLYVVSDLRTMTAIWMGLITIAGAEAEDKLTLTGDREVAAGVQTWLGLGPFALQPKRTAA